MFDRIIQFIYRSVWTALVLFAVSAVVLVVDGLRDIGDRVDLAIVPGYTDMESGEPWANVQPRLDKVIQLYQAGKFTTVLVSGSVKKGDYYEAGNMVQYLESKGVPSSAIIGDEGNGDTQTTTHRWVGVMKDRNLTSVMVVTTYYQVTRLKLALWQQGATPVEQNHVGALQASDTYDIGRETIEFYHYLGKYYFGGAWREIKSVAGTVKNAVNGWFDSLVR